MLQFATGADFLKATGHIQPVGIDRLEVRDVADGRDFAPAGVGIAESLQQPLVVHVGQDAGQADIGKLRFDGITGGFEPVAAVDHRVAEAIGKRGLKNESLRTHAGPVTLLRGLNGRGAELRHHVVGLNAGCQQRGRMNGVTGLGVTVGGDEDSRHAGHGGADGFNKLILGGVDCPAFSHGFRQQIGVLAAERGDNGLAAHFLGRLVLVKLSLNSGLDVDRRRLGRGGIGRRRGRRSGDL